MTTKKTVTKRELATYITNGLYDKWLVEKEKLKYPSSYELTFSGVLGKVRVSKHATGYRIHDVLTTDPKLNYVSFEEIDIGRLSDLTPIIRRKIPNKIVKQVKEIEKHMRENIVKEKKVNTELERIRSQIYDTIMFMVKESVITLTESIVINSITQEVGIIEHKIAKINNHIKITDQYKIGLKEHSFSDLYLMM